MPKAKGPGKVHRYNNEFKVKAVQLANPSGVLTQDVVEALEIHPFMLFRWKKEYREGKLVAKRGERVRIDHKTPGELERLRKIEREHAILKEEHALLKKAIRFCSERRARSSST
jgi:transposase